MSKLDDRIVWVDVESTGLNPYGGARLLEIACVITDAELNIVDQAGYEAIVRYSTNQMLRMRRGASDYVRKMHDETGLWEETVSRGSKPLIQIDTELAHYIKRHSGGKKLPLGGNSVRLDFNFIDRYLPNVSAELYYQMIDVSSIAGLAHRWYDIARPSKLSDHTAMTDIRASIEELRYYREQVFKCVYDGFDVSDLATGFARDRADSMYASRENRDWERAYAEARAGFFEVLDRDRPKASGTKVPIERNLLLSFIDPYPCEWDHNHSCQAHGYHYIPEGEKCPIQELKDLIGWTLYD